MTDPTEPRYQELRKRLDRPHAEACRSLGWFVDSSCTVTHYRAKDGTRKGRTEQWLVMRCNSAYAGECDAQMLVNVNDLSDLVSADD